MSSTASPEDFFYVPDTLPDEPFERDDSCARNMKDILAEAVRDTEYSSRIQPDSKVTMQLMDPLPSASLEGPDGPTRMFWCESAHGTCEYSFLLQSGKPGLPPLITEEAVAVRGACYSMQRLQLSFWRARQAMLKGMDATEAAQPENDWLRRGLNE